MSQGSLESFLNSSSNESYSSQIMDEFNASEVTEVSGGNTLDGFLNNSSTYQDEMLSGYAGSSTSSYLENLKSSEDLPVEVEVDTNLDFTDSDAMIEEDSELLLEEEDLSFEEEETTPEKIKSAQDQFSEKISKMKEKYKEMMDKVLSIQQDFVDYRNEVSSKGQEWFDAHKHEVERKIKSYKEKIDGAKKAAEDWIRKQQKAAQDWIKEQIKEIKTGAKKEAKEKAKFEKKKKEEEQKAKADAAMKIIEKEVFSKLTMGM